jgi:hypothetical protein
MTGTSKHYPLAAMLVLAIGGAATARAQTTNFSGTWMFDAAKSTGTPELPSIGGSEGTAVGPPAGGAEAGRGRGGNGAPRPAGTFDPATGRRSPGVIDFNKLIIKQSSADINLTHGGVELLYKLDGTERNISALNRAGYPPGKAAWEGGKLVLTTRQSVYKGKGEYVTLERKEVYSLQGGILTIDKTEMTRDGKTITKKLVYTKATS